VTLLSFHLRHFLSCSLCLFILQLFYGIFFSFHVHSIHVCYACLHAHFLCVHSLDAHFAPLCDNVGFFICSLLLFHGEFYLSILVLFLFHGEFSFSTFVMLFLPNGLFLLVFTLVFPLLWSFPFCAHSLFICDGLSFLVFVLQFHHWWTFIFNVPLVPAFFLCSFIMH